MNYADLFRVTLPETALEIAALVVLVVDLGFLRKAALQTRVMSAVLLSVIGCGVSLVTLPLQAYGGLTYPGSADLLLSSGGYTAIAQAGILTLTVLTLFLLVGSDFTQHVGEYAAVVLMAATGGLLISAAQDLLVIFVGLELLSLGLYILTAFAKRSGKSAEAAIGTIIDQGEGAPGHSETSHYNRFLRVRQEYDAFVATDPPSEPAFPAAHNPVSTALPVTPWKEGAPTNRVAE